MAEQTITESYTPTTSTSTVATTADNNDDDDLNLLPLYMLLPMVVVVSVVVIVAVAGNLLVMAAYARDPQLRTVSNLYLLHLAVCDLLLASVSMPVYLVASAMRHTWPFGRVFCKVYLMNDYTLCAMSVCLVILISHDQLLILRKGALYATVETKAKAYVKVTIAWLFSFLLYGPAIVFWDLWVGQSVLGPGDCDVEFHENEAYTLVTVCLEFVLPSVALTALNLAVYWEIRKRTKVSNHARSAVAAITNGKMSQCDNPEGERHDGESTRKLHAGGRQAAISSGLSVLRINTLSNTGAVCRDDSPFVCDTQEVVNNGQVEATTYESSDTCTPQKVISDVIANHDDLNSEPPAALSHTSGERLHPSASAWNPDQPVLRVITGNEHNASTANLSTAESKPSEYGEHLIKFISTSSTFDKTAESPSHRRPCATLNIHTTSNCSNITQETQDSKKNHKTRLTKTVRKDLKAARALFVFVFAFLLLWSPYTIATAVLACCDECVNFDVYEVFTWWLWIKSAVNPFIYAAINHRFRTNFIKILSRARVSCK